MSGNGERRRPRHGDDRRRRPRQLPGAALAAVAIGSLAVPAQALAATPPPGTAYEMVSPPAKSNGGVVFGHRASDDGSALAFQMNAATGADDGAFALTPYIARRTPSGWESRSAAPPIRAEHRGSSEVSAWAADFSDDFSRATIQTNDTIDPADREPIESGNLGTGFDLYEFDPFSRQARWISRPVAELAAEYGPGGPSAAFVGRSRDSSHLVFTTSGRLVPEAPAIGVSLGIVYESVDGQNRLVAVLPDGTPFGGWSRAASPQRFIAQTRGNQAVSKDGSRIFWTTVGEPAGDAIYLREDGVRTLVVSASRASGREGEVAGGIFLGATRDGARVYFASSTQLTDDPEAVDGGLYRWDRAGEQVTFLTRSDGFDDMSYYGPVLSEENEQLYFTTSGTNPLTGVADGSRNLYLWDGSSLRHIAPISADTFLYADPRLRVTTDGRFAAFTTAQSLDPRHVDGTVAVYRYDAEADALACASCRTDGGAAAGPAELTSSVSRYAVLADARNVAPRNFADDGRLYFQTPDPLAAEDTNQALDVYSFDGQAATLVSSGSGEGSELVDNSDDGSSVFFTTAERLLKRDTDGGYPDVYVARIGGGFPEPVDADDGGCLGDACQGGSSPPPAFPVPGSALVEPTAGADERRATERWSVTRPSARQLRRFAAGGTMTLRVAVPRAGRLSAVARATVGRRQRVIARASRNVGKAGNVALNLRLSAAGRRQLAARGALRVRLTVQMEGAAAQRMTLRVPKPARPSNARGR